jgi:hypothetical protein
MNTTIAVATIALVIVTLYYAWQTRVIADATKAAAEAARKSAEATERSSQGSLLIALLREYGSPDFSDSLDLIARGQRIGWEIKDRHYRIKQDQVGDTKAINHARHRIWWFYKNAYSLFRRQLLSKEDFKIIAETNGYVLMFHILRDMSELLHPNDATKASHFRWVDEMRSEFPAPEVPNN